MGVYNTYAGCQIKVSDDLSLKEFKIGDNVDIPDGIYISLDGVVVVKNNILVAANERIFDKWGNEIDQQKIISVIKQNNPVKQALDEYKRLDGER
jgi:hypothetical protein